MPELEDVIVATTNAGDHFSLALTGDWSTDISEALEEEHGQCEDASCDIREAMQNGFPLSAAHLLVGATEAPVIDAVWRAYDRAGAIPKGERFTDWPASEREAWMAHHQQWGRKCPACGSYTFAHANWEPDSCANCLAEFVRTYRVEIIGNLDATKSEVQAKLNELAAVLANAGDESGLGYDWQIDAEPIEED